MIVLAATVLIVVHMVDGRVVQINPLQITQLIHAQVSGSHAKGVLVDSVKCVVRLTDGSFVSVAEDCDEVRRIVESVK